MRPLVIPALAPYWDPLAPSPLPLYRGPTGRQLIDIEPSSTDDKLDGSRTPSQHASA